MKNLSDLPNQHGFRFVGFTLKGLRVRCKVVQDPDNKVHYVVRIRDNEPFFSKLIGWEKEIK